MRSVYVCCVSFFLLQAQTLQWAFNMAGSLGTDAYGVAVTSDGSVVVTGAYQGTVDFEPSTGVTNLTAAGGWDIFIAKYDANGNLLWAKGIGNIGWDQAMSVALTSTGNIAIIGWFEGSVDFDPGTATTTLNANGGRDAFIALYDNNGNFLWAQSYGTTNNETARAVAIDNNDNCIVVTDDGQIFKYTATGTLLWNKSIAPAYINDVAVASNNTIAITGFFQGTVDFDPGAGTNNLSAIGLADIFLATYDNNGNLLWAISMGGTSWEEGTAIAIKTDGSVYLAGVFSGTVDFDPSTATMNLTSVGGNDVFLAKYASNGTLAWVKAFGGSGYEWCNDIALLADKGLLLTGNFANTVDFDPDPTSIVNLTSAGLQDIFVAKYDSSGNYVWAFGIGDANGDMGRRIALYGSEVIIVGSFQGSPDFDPGTGSVILNSAGGNDAFVAKYGNIVTAAPKATLPTFRLFPNPTQQQLILQWNKPCACSLSLFDQNGRLLQQQALEITRRQTIFNLTSLPAGIYLLQVKQGDKVSYYRIMKH